MRLVLLGTTGYHPNDVRETACYFFPELGLVLDAGTGLYRLGDYLQTPGLEIYLSHAHLDHVIGLTYLLELSWTRQLQDVVVHGEAEKLAAVEQHLFAPLIFPVPPKLAMRPIEQHAPLPGGGRITHFPLQHPGGSLGFRLDWPEASLAYVTDTMARPGADYIEQIRGVDVLLHECNFGDDEAQWCEKTGHSNTTAVAELAREAKPGLLVLTHLAPHKPELDPVGLATAKKIFPNTLLAQDRMEIEF